MSVSAGETVSELAVFMIDRSAEAAETGTVTEEELLSGLGSGVSEDRTAVFTMEPAAESLTVPRMRITADVSASMVSRLRGLDQGKKVVPLSKLYSGARSSDGATSARTTFLASEGPRLETRRR